jgi:hypothetical protein
MKCGICYAGPRRRNAVDKHLLRGESLRATAHRFGFSEDQMQRHKARHLQRALVAAADKDSEHADLGYGERLLREIAGLKRDALALQRTAQGQRDVKAALKALHERLAILEVEARLSGAIKSGESGGTKSLTVNVHQHVTREEALQYARDLIELFGPGADAPQSPQAHVLEAGKANGHGD